MCRVAFVWTCVACVGLGRRVQPLDAAFVPSSSPGVHRHAGATSSPRASVNVQNHVDHHAPLKAPISADNNQAYSNAPIPAAMISNEGGFHEHRQKSAEDQENDSWYGRFRIPLLGCGAGIGGFFLSAVIGKAAARARSPAMSEMECRTEAQTVLQEVQAHFVKQLEAVSIDGASSKGEFAPSSWERDEGRHGGGTRYGVEMTPIFNRASVNYSGVMYDDAPEKPVKSATAISVIIHPQNPNAPSMHCHFSYTEPRNSPPYWRMISDLNPSLHNPDAKNKFERALKDLCPQPLFDEGKLFGDKYFFIPELNMYRGTSHFFVPALSPNMMDSKDSLDLAKNLATATIDTYTSIIQERMDATPKETVTERQKKEQLAYHTAYFFQVLFLDRGTTAGIMAHSDNDLGTFASLPTYVDRRLLESWLENKVLPPHDILLSRILELLPDSDEPIEVTNDIRLKLVKVCRDYYLEDKTRVQSQADMDVEGWKKQHE